MSAEPILSETPKDSVFFHRDGHVIHLFVMQVMHFAFTVKVFNSPWCPFVQPIGVYCFYIYDQVLLVEFSNAKPFLQGV